MLLKSPGESFYYYFSDKQCFFFFFYFILWGVEGRVKETMFVNAIVLSFELNQPFVCIGIQSGNFSPSLHQSS